MLNLKKLCLILKQLIIIISLILPMSIYGTNIRFNTNDNVPLRINNTQNQSTPKDTSIQASINDHYLTVVFTENIGQVTVEVSKISGGESQIESTPTPNGVNFYIYDTGSYIVTFYLSNGDEYYGEFDVTD